MHSFRFQYKDETFHATAVFFKEDGNLRYRISLAGGFTFVIAASGIRGLDGRIIWVQSNKPGEIIHPHGMVQMIGEAMESVEKTYWLI